MRRSTIAQAVIALLLCLTLCACGAGQGKESEALCSNVGTQPGTEAPHSVVTTEADEEPAPTTELVTDTEPITEAPNTEPASSEPETTDAPDPNEGEEDYEDHLKAEGAAIIEKLQAEFSRLSEEIDDSYSGYIDRKEAVEAWYALCISESETFYRAVADENYAKYKELAASGKLTEYRKWDREMSDLYDAWNDALSDYYDDWTDLFEDAYDLFDDVVSKGYDEVAYSKAADEWRDMYDTYSDSWSDMYELYSDMWKDLYEFHSDVWSEFYRGDQDVDRIHEKAFH